MTRAKHVLSNIEGAQKRQVRNHKKDQPRNTQKTRKFGKSPVANFVCFVLFVVNSSPLFLPLRLGAFARENLELLLFNKLHDSNFY